MSTWIKPRGGPSHRPSPDGSSYATAEYNVPRESLPRTQEVLEYYGGYTEPYSTEDYNYTWSEDSCRQEDSRRDELYQQFYREIEDDYNKEKHADCVVIALSKQQGDYAKLVGRRVQELGLLVDLVYLKLELALDTALKDVREEGSPFCVVVGGEHQSLSSCTVIILYAGHKEHRNMPLEDALDLISREHQRIFGETLEKERLEIAHKAANLADDYLHRESYDESHVVPSSIRHLLFLLGDGKHLYAEELQKKQTVIGKTIRKEELSFISGHMILLSLNKPPELKVTMMLAVFHSPPANLNPSFRHQADHPFWVMLLLLRKNLHFWVIDQSGLFCLLQVIH
ncbi:nuclear receptor coactivator 5-like isoform X4 [Rhincodon typus]|uniref:nuclear receptor coactivator 5-like isoform X4 n=1 Tax=Rhincodon typus TaxID=259920 RepID=UPI00202F88FB|nr:nuclear receptor coactivator 5-like isoform X4 [Rhincodon typus]